MVILQTPLRQQRSVASSHDKAGKLPAGLGSGTPLSCTRQRRPVAHQLMALPCHPGPDACRAFASPQHAPRDETGLLPHEVLSCPPWGDANPSGDAGSGTAAPGGCLLLFWGGCARSFVHLRLCDSPMPLPTATLCFLAIWVGKAASECCMCDERPLFCGVFPA